MDIKIECSCGQHYKFDVEPEDGRMPVAVACPGCGVDGTDAANNYIQQVLVIQMPTLAPPSPAGRPALRIGGQAGLEASAAPPETPVELAPAPPPPAPGRTAAVAAGPALRK